MPEKKSTKQETPKTKEPVIYIGPSIVGVATKGTVYKNGLTPQMGKAVEELPALNTLLVEIGKITQARKDLKNKESAVSICYAKAEEYARKKGAKG